MISSISSWASSLIIAVMISVIFEMILPDCKNKKYVKMVIGLYILFTILSPIISKPSIDFEKKMDISNIEKNSFSEKSAENLTKTSLKDAFILSIKQDIHSKLRDKGFVVSTIKVDANVENENSGKINSLEIGISKKSGEGKIKNENSITINKVNINNTTSSKEETISITESEYMELKEFISIEYGVDINNIKLT